MPCASYSRNEPLTVAPSDRLPTSSAIATKPSSLSSSQRGRGRIGPSTRGSAGAPAGRLARVASTVIRPRPFEPHPDLADLQLVAEAHRRDALDAAAVDVRAVRAAEVLDVPAAAAVGQDGVVGRRERVLDDDRVVDVATERRDDLQAERPGRPAAHRSATRARPAGRVARSAPGPPLAGRAAGRGRRGTRNR